MSILLYCMTEVDSASEIATLPPGMGEAPVESLAEGGVRCFYSRVEDLLANADSFRAEALRFHAVLREILGHVTVLPFRFPTLLQTDSEFGEFLASQAPAYLEDLRRLRGMIQMEIRISTEVDRPDPQSGKQYMEARAAQARALDAHAGTALAAARDLITQWRARSEPGGLRCYALVRREQTAAFEERMRLLTPLQNGRMVVSGPWPPSEFLHVQST